MDPEPLTADEYEVAAMLQIEGLVREKSDSPDRIVYATLAQAYATLAVSARLREMPR